MHRRPLTSKLGVLNHSRIKVCCFLPSGCSCSKTALRCNRNNTVNGCSQEPMMRSNFLAVGFGYVHLVSSRVRVLPSYHKHFDIRIYTRFNLDPLTLFQSTLYPFNTCNNETQCMEGNLKAHSLWSWMTKKLWFNFQHWHEIFSTKHPGLSPRPTHPFPYSVAAANLSSVV